MPPFYFTNGCSVVGSPSGAERIPCDLATGGSGWLTPAAIAAMVRNRVYPDTGALNAMVITIPGIASYADLLNIPIWINPANSNTTNAVTINVNGLGVQNFNTVGTGGYGNVGIGTLAANKISEIVWDGTTFQYLGRVVTASTAQIIAGTDAISPVTSASLAGAFPHSVFNNTSNYQEFPSGYIIQEGVFTPSTGSADAITLPFTFPNRGVSCVATVLESHTVAYFAMISFTNNSTLSVSTWNVVGPTIVAGATIHWIAIGH